MSVQKARWPRGTGQWSRTRVVVVSTNRELIRMWSEQHDVVAATTPLELITQLEQSREGISTVVVSDLVGSAAERELAEFLDAYYPWLRVITDRSMMDEPDTIVGHPIAHVAVGDDEPVAVG